jgi:hypothetical protein
MCWRIRLTAGSVSSGLAGASHDDVFYAPAANVSSFRPSSPIPEPLNATRQPGF